MYSMPLAKLQFFFGWNRCQDIQFGLECIQSPVYIWYVSWNNASSVRSSVSRVDRPWSEIQFIIFSTKILHSGSQYSNPIYKSPSPLDVVIRKTKVETQKKSWKKKSRFSSYKRFIAWTKRSFVEKEINNLVTLWEI